MISTKLCSTSKLACPEQAFFALSWHLPKCAGENSN